MKKPNEGKRGITGLVILAIGVLLLMRNFGIYENFIDEYIWRWEMIIIGIGVINLLSHEGPAPGFLFIIIGGALYARDYVNMPTGISFWQLFLGGVFIIAGIFMIFKRKHHFQCENKMKEKVIDMNTIDEMAIFGGGDRTIISDNFKGGKMTGIFGGSNINLTRSNLAPGKNYIDMLAVFGGFKLIVPEHWNIKVDATTIFGGFTDQNRHHSKQTFSENEPQLIIKGLLIFGGVEIKSY